MAIKTYEIERNELVYEQIIGIANQYCKWTDGDWDYVKFHLDATYEAAGNEGLRDFFNKTFYDVAILEWK